MHVHWIPLYICHINWYNTGGVVTIIFLRICMQNAELNTWGVYAFTYLCISDAFIAFHEIGSVGSIKIKQISSSL